MEIAEFLLARIAEDEAGHERMAEALLREGHEDFTWKARAECGAKRRIVKDVFPDVVAMTNAYVDATDESPGIWPWAADRLLMLLALPYADHPDYRPEWKV